MTNLLSKIIKMSGLKTAIFLDKNKFQDINVVEKYAQLGQIYSGIIHDLTSPITALGLQFEILEGQKIKNFSQIEAMKEALRDIQKYSKLVKSYISNDESRQWIDLGKEISNSIKLISYNAIKRNIQIQFIRKNDIKIFASKIQIYQIIISLVSNAIESFEEKTGNRKIIVKIEKIKANKVLSIKDFGVGIENSEIIFSPFYTTKMNAGGTGIGLSSVKQIVEKSLGGKIEVISEPEKGSEFKIIL